MKLLRIKYLYWDCVFTLYDWANVEHLSEIQALVLFEKHDGLNTSLSVNVYFFVHYTDFRDSYGGKVCLCMIRIVIWLCCIVWIDMRCVFTLETV
jgi:hypothetical protein